MNYALPTYERNHKDEPRKVGFELEFSDLEVEEVADIIAETFDGSIERKSEILFEVSAPSLGKFTVELDWQLGKKIAEERTGKSMSAGRKGGDTVMQWLKWLAGQVVPVEIVCPPLPLDDMAQLDSLVDALRAKGAKGTDESLVYAFGVHINPEIPDDAPACIAGYLKAFSLAQDWLFSKNGIDPVRKVSPYIKPYDKEYIEHVLAYGSDITLEQLIDDYLSFNPSRNRALDMTVLWKHLCPRCLKDNDFDDSMTSARPTFHYRLPNCEIDKKKWYLSTSWNLWCVVEYIAAREELIDSLSAKRQESLQAGLFKSDTAWHDEFEKIADGLQSA